MGNGKYLNKPSDKEAEKKYFTCLNLTQKHSPTCWFSSCFEHLHPVDVLDK